MSYVVILISIFWFFFIEFRASLVELLTILRFRKTPAKLGALTYNLMGT